MSVHLSSPSVPPAAASSGPSKATLRRLARCAAVAVAPWGLAACVATSPNWDAGFGTATRTLVEQQRLDPEATARHGETVPPADGREVRRAVDRVNGAGATSSTSATVLGLGAGTSGGSQ